ncbi:MAG TPA: PDZ domain-containing protein, partial [Planctomycetaceae bacterium]|nr:PDZ domain-containing protein [Planctomycetaceae bacterium]
GAAIAVDSPPRPKTDAVQIDRWIAELDHDAFAVREAATLSLAKSGVAALPALMKAVREASPEVRIRATQVLAAWYSRPDKDMVDAVEDALEQLLDAEGTIGDQADVTWDSQRRAREQRCLAHLEELGAGIEYRDDAYSVDRDEPGVRNRAISYIAITLRWKGGDDGLKYIRRMRPTPLSPGFIVYRINGNTVSDAAFQALEDNGHKVEKRGAKLGVHNTSGFGFNPARVDVPGFRIENMNRDSPAEKSGLLVDDIITQFGDKPVTDFNDLVSYLLATKPGDKVVFTVLREKQGERVPEKVTVELGDW